MLVNKVDWARVWRALKLERFCEMVAFSESRENIVLSTMRGEVKSFVYFGGL